MINRIIDLSVRHRTAVIAAVGAACFAGWRSMVQVPVNAIPDLGETQVVLYSKWDRSPDRIEGQVTYPMVTV